ncbi:hypothetical protein M513_10271 [Trichuris suis]|uniref:Uncharacterized protein n=1 Tax=Trichuris suis TaxID=68888 RepID=A0A085LVB2_9BILA|nr:hypothetical protein M513_10271 [Trichuris suis]
MTLSGPHITQGSGSGRLQPSSSSQPDSQPIGTETRRLDKDVIPDQTQLLLLDGADHSKQISAPGLFEAGISVIPKAARLSERSFGTPAIIQPATRGRVAYKNRWRIFGLRKKAIWNSGWDTNSHQNI